MVFQLALYFCLPPKSVTCPSQSWNHLVHQNLWLQKYGPSCENANSNLLCNNIHKLAVETNLHMPSLITFISYKASYVSTFLTPWVCVCVCVCLEQFFQHGSFPAFVAGPGTGRQRLPTHQTTLSQGPQSSRGTVKDHVDEPHPLPEHQQAPAPLVPSGQAWPVSPWTEELCESRRRDSLTRASIKNES